MADTFEQFKFGSSTPAKLNRAHNKVFYQECKAVISDLLQENHKFLSEIQRKDQIVQQLISQKDALKNKLESFQSVKQENQRKNQNNTEKMKKLQSRINDYQELLHQKDIKIENLQTELQQMHSKLTKSDLSIQTYKNNIQMMKKKINTLEQTLSLVSEENSILSNTLHQKQIQSSYQMEQLKKFNENMKRKMQMFSQFQEESPFQYTLTSPIPSEQKKRTYRAISTDKKYTKVPSYQSTQVLRPSNYPYRFNKKQQKKITPFHLQNPQMGKQLKDLKQTLSQGYSKFQLLQTGYNKQRAQKTLAKLQNKIGKMISKVQCSDSQSCMD